MRRPRKIENLEPVPLPPIDRNTRAQIVEMLKDALKVEISTRTYSDFSSQGVKVTVALSLDGEVISQSEEHVDVAIRDTSESWRSSFGDS
ncbi:MAG: hypothetical protein EOP83_29555 [Verrucomicrobiaceae bacterium]|nr:MAG: hypothetical protein EOP83_29555 [Verrucomicrobiaceae bacterium]